jgi:dienelactone hydrolase
MRDFLKMCCILVAVATIAPVARADEQQQPKPSAWDAKFFDYDAPKDLIVEQTTPTPDQVDFKSRPPQTAGDRPVIGTKWPAKPRTVGPLDIVHIRFTDSEGDVVPALLCTPAGKKGPFPVVIAVHGLRSNKAQVCGQVAPALAKRGFAVLAPDMPLHGERRGQPPSPRDRPDPMKVFKSHRHSIIDVRQCIDVAQTLPQIDHSKGVILVGYSMGSWIDSIVGPADPRVKAMVLMVGGATEIAQAMLLIPQVAAVDPRLALAQFSRPLLLQNGKDDNVVTPEMGERLFASASDPKEQVWYDSGHLLPQKAYDDAAEWIEQTWGTIKQAD